MTTRALVLALATALAAPVAAAADTGPANDDFASARPIQILGDWTGVDADNRGATVEAGEPLPCGEIGATVWYRFTVSEPRQLRLTGEPSFATQSDDGDPVAAVYTGDALRSLVAVDCSDDSEGTGPSILFDAEPGVEYRVQVGGWRGSEASVELSIETIADRGRVDGIVRHADGPTLSGVCVEAQTTALGVWLGRVEWTDAEGRFAFTDLPPGPYRFAANDCGENIFGETTYPAVRETILVAPTTRHSFVASLSGGAPAENDAFAAAPEIALGDAVFGHTRLATTEPGEPSACAARATVWFRFTAPRTERLALDLNSVAMPDVALAVFTGTEFADLTPVTACSAARFAQRTLDVGAGRTYFIQVFGPKRRTGSFHALLYPLEDEQPEQPQPIPEPGRHDGAISGASPLDPTCATPEAAAVGAEVEPHAAVDPSNPQRIVAAWQQDRFASHGGARSNGVAASADGGRTWTRTTVPGISQCTGGKFTRATDPWTAFGKDGTAYLATLAFNGDTQGPNALLVSRSTDGGMTWARPSTVIEDVALLLNDKEAITVDAQFPNIVYVVWAKFPGAVFHLSRSVDGGATWLPAVPMPHLSPGQGNHIVSLADGRLINVFTGLLGIAASVSLDKGTTWGPPVGLGGSSSSSIRTKDGRTVRAPGMPSAAAGPDGRVYVAWSEGRRVVITSSADGITWSRKAVVSSDTWYQFTPSVAVAPDGTVGVSFYDFRRDQPGGTSWTDLWLATSRDGGTTWSEQHVSGPFDIRQAPNASGLFLGDYQGIVATTDAFIPVFSRTAVEGSWTDIHAPRVSVP